MKQENKRAYLAPSIKVVSVRSERGFQASNQTQTATKNYGFGNAFDADVSSTTGTESVSLNSSFGDRW